MEETGEDQLDSDSPWPEDIYLPPRRRRLGTWIATLCLLASFALLGWAAEKRYHIVAFVQHRAIGTPQVDPRAESFLAEGERALLEGNLDAAQGDFDKAGILVERDPRALLGEARVAAAKADVPWLRVRLLPPGAQDQARVAKAELQERVAVAKRTADDALAAAPQDPAALRAKLDALRLAGDSEAARGYVVAVFAQSSQPETAYALAALDLLQPTSPWATIIDRLRVAASGDAAGRARAALVYALAKSGDAAGAKAELAKLDAQSRPYPLLPDLHALVSGERTVAPEAPPPAAASSAPPAPPSPAAPESPAVGGSGRPITTLQAAAQAFHRGDFDRAERIYRAILATEPNESQALTGLGDVLRSRNDPWGAIEEYQHAINVNPSYLPALLGLADTQWARGDRSGAAKSYKRIVDHFPDGMYPEYVNQRVTP